MEGGPIWEESEYRRRRSKKKRRKRNLFHKQTTALQVQDFFYNSYKHWYTIKQPDRSLCLINTHK